MTRNCFTVEQHTCTIYHVKFSSTLSFSPSLSLLQRDWASLIGATVQACCVPSTSNILVIFWSKITCVFVCSDVLSHLGTEPYNYQIRKLAATHLQLQACNDSCSMHCRKLNYIHIMQYKHMIVQKKYVITQKEYDCIQKHVIIQKRNTVITKNKKSCKTYDHPKKHNHTKQHMIT